jgi:hypothetical protein
MSGQHIIDIPAGDLDPKWTQTVTSDPKKYIPLEDFLAELNKPLPWYKNIYDFFIYRIPYKLEYLWDSIFVFLERGRKGYAKSDMWNAHIYLSELISNITRDLANESHGHPPELESIEEWKIVLGMISSGFAKVIEIDERGNCATKEEQRQIDEAFELLQKYFIYLWD